MSTIKRCLMLSLCEILSRTLLNSSRLGGFSNTAMWQWIRHLLKFFLPVFLSMLKWNSTFSFLLSSSKISASKASCVFLQLKLPSNIFSNILACSASVGSAIQHLLLPLWTQPLKELAKLYFWGLYLNSIFRWTGMLFKYIRKYYGVMKIVYFIKLAKIF